MMYKSGSVDRFEQVSKFQSLNEFNHHFEMLMLEKRGAFSRKNGSQTSNLNIFGRFPWNDHINKTINPSETKNKEISKRKLETMELDHTNTRSRIPKSLLLGRESKFQKKGRRWKEWETGGW